MPPISKAPMEAKKERDHKKSRGQVLTEPKPSSYTTKLCTPTKVVVMDSARIPLNKSR